MYIFTVEVASPVSSAICFVSIPISMSSFIRSDVSFSYAPTESKNFFNFDSGIFSALAAPFMLPIVLYVCNAYEIYSSCVILPNCLFLFPPFNMPPQGCLDSALFVTPSRYSIRSASVLIFNLTIV